MTDVERAVLFFLTPWLLLPLVLFISSVRNMVLDSAFYHRYKFRRLGRRIQDQRRGIARAFSSIGIEQPALNRQVLGSSPRRPTGHPPSNPGLIVKRRIKWKNGRYAEASLPGGHTSIFRWADEKRLGNIRMQGPAQVADEITVWHLLWDGLQVEKFDSEEKLKEFIICFVYGVDKDTAAPSELLVDAGLLYRKDGHKPIWVDDWMTPRNDLEIIGFTGTFPYPSLRPIDRKIRLVGTGAQPEPKDPEVPASFLRLERGANGRDRLVQVEAPPVSVRTNPGPRRRFKPISREWEDFSWEARAWRPVREPRPTPDSEGVFALPSPRPCQCGPKGQGRAKKKRTAVKKKTV